MGVRCSRMMAFATLAAAVLLLRAAPAKAESYELTLDQAVERGIEENRDIAVARERLAEIEGMKGEARAEGLPQLTGTGLYQRMWRKPKVVIGDVAFRMGSNNTVQAGVEFDQLLWDGGRVIKAVRAARSEVARGIENIRDAEVQVRYQVKETFHSILYADKLISVLEKQLATLRQHLGSIRTRFSEGVESDYALLRQQVEVSNIEPQLIDAKRNRELLVNTMKVLLAIPQEDGFLPKGTFDYQAHATPSIEELMERARAARPDLQAEKLRVKSLQENVGVEKAGYWPRFSFNTSFQWQALTDDWRIGGNERNDSLQSSVLLSWPIFDGLKTRSRVQQARARLAQQQFMTSQLEDNVLKQVRDAHEILARAQEALRSQQQSLQLARKATAIAGERFEAGLMSQIELNDTITAQTEAERLYLQSSVDCLVAEAALEKAVGGGL